MYRLWGKIMIDSRFRSDYVFELEDGDIASPTSLKKGLEFLTLHFDIEMPMWLSDNEKDYARFRKTRFYNDHFIETIDFDYFEIEVIEDKKKKHKKSDF